MKGCWPVTYLEENTDAQVHKWFGEINDHLSSIVNGHRAHGQINFLSIVEKRIPCTFYRCMIKVLLNLNVFSDCMLWVFMTHSEMIGAYFFSAFV